MKNETLKPSKFLIDMLNKAARKRHSEWCEGVEYTKGAFVIYNNVLYRVIQEHTSHPDSTPDVAESLFAKAIDFDNKVIYKQKPRHRR